MRKESNRFVEALSYVRESQEQILFKILSKNKNTEYGRKYSFSNIKSVVDYQKSIPLSGYDEYIPYIRKIGDGHRAVLTEESVRLFEPSSGTASATKYIPYTSDLRQEFQRGIYPWLIDTYSANPNLLRGSSYWSITPPNIAPLRTSGGIPIGFEEDSSYLGAAAEVLINQIFAVPSEIKKVMSIDSFLYITLLFLLKTKDLVLLSVWNPTFLMLLLEPIKMWQGVLLNDLAEGKIRPPGSVPRELCASLERKLGRHPKRANELDTLFQNFSETIYSAIWPKLSLISCWADGNSAPYVYQIQKMFPSARIQGKGLLATEGIVTIPYSLAGGNILAVRSHFYEFIDQDNQQIKTAWELEEGKCYSVALTTGGGFYRYKLLDLVRVSGLYKQCPVLSFIGKEEKISDYFGEKLHEHFVSEVLSRLLVRYELRPRFYMVAPEERNGTISYVLFVEPLDTSETSRWLKLVQELDGKLKENFHYAHCRNLGQLRRSTLFIISSKGAETYLAECKKQGQKLGNIKPSVLHAKKGWSDKFVGEYPQERER